MSLEELTLPQDRSASSTIPEPKRDWRTRLLLPILLVGATAILILLAAWRTLFPGLPVRVIPVMIKNVEASAGSTAFSASGWLEPDPYAIYVTALASGTVEEVSVLEGERVTRGQVLARLVADDAKIAVAGAIALTETRRAEVARAEAEQVACEEILETLVDRREGLQVAEAREAEARAAIRQLNQEIAAEQSQLDSLADSVERKSKLIDSGAVSVGQLHRLTLDRDAQQARLLAFKEKGPVLDARLQQTLAQTAAARKHLKLLIEEKLAVANANANLDLAQARLRSAEAQQRSAQLELDRMTLLAPCDGIVLKRLISPGSTLLASGGALHAAHVMHLYQPSKLQVRVDVPLADAAAVGVDQKVEVIVEVLPDRTFAGHVSRLVHEADVQKNTIEVKVAVDTPDAILKPEMLARVRFLAHSADRSSRRRVLIPESLVFRHDGRDATWVVVERSAGLGRAQLRTLELGEVTATDDQKQTWREVRSGLQPGDWVIQDPPRELSPGRAVVIEGEQHE